MIAIHGLRIEFWFYKESNGMLSIQSTAVKSKHRNEVFPVKYVPFDGMNLPVPKNAEQLLAKEYGKDWKDQKRCSPAAAAGKQ